MKAESLACPKCKGPSKVIDSRPNKLFVSRRRVCTKCKERFNTEERFTSFNKRVAKYGDSMERILKDEAEAFARNLP